MYALTVRWCGAAVQLGARSPLPLLVSTVTQTGRNRQATLHVQDGMDAEEARAVRAEGLDPDDPAVVATGVAIRGAAAFRLARALIGTAELLDELPD
jgi:hypothetical protein